mmetsp:Transcript_24516/g.70428  ORF Transcript_24516/g.70428 Transcript_24516/m.70428 type:complete len:258 (-) Transcript_24516:257-1030(-)
MALLQSLHPVVGRLQVLTEDLRVLDLLVELILSRSQPLCCGVELAVHLLHVAVDLLDAAVQVRDVVLGVLVVLMELHCRSVEVLQVEPRGLQASSVVRDPLLQYLHHGIRLLKLVSVGLHFVVGLTQGLPVILQGRLHGILLGLDVLDAQICPAQLVPQGDQVLFNPSLKCLLQFAAQGVRVGQVLRQLVQVCVGDLMRVAELRYVLVGLLQTSLELLDVAIRPGQLVALSLCQRVRVGQPILQREQRGVRTAGILP